MITRMVSVMETTGMKVLFKMKKIILTFLIVYFLYTPGNVIDDEKDLLENIINTTVTAYSGIDGCNNPGCLMANGKKAHVGAIACPRTIKLGTKVLFDNQIYICSDRMNKRYTNRFDIFTGFGKEAHKKALDFGIKKTTVLLLN